MQFESGWASSVTDRMAHGSVFGITLVTGGIERHNGIGHRTMYIQRKLGSVVKIRFYFVQARVDFDYIIIYYII